MLWGCHVMPSLASALSALKNPRRGTKGGGGGGESALKTPPNPPSNPFPSDCRCSSRPSAQGCGPGSVSAEGEALGGGEGGGLPAGQSNGTFSPNQQRLLEIKKQQQQKKPITSKPPRKQN